MTRQPFWGDYILIGLSVLTSAALIAMGVVLWSIRRFVISARARGIMLSFIWFIGTMCAVLIANMLSRVVFVTYGLIGALQYFVVAQIAFYGAAAVVALWLCFTVLRPYVSTGTFKDDSPP